MYAEQQTTSLPLAGTVHRPLRDLSPSNPVEFALDDRVSTPTRGLGSKNYNQNVSSRSKPTPKPAPNNTQNGIEE